MASIFGATTSATTTLGDSNYNVSQVYQSAYQAQLAQQQAIYSGIAGWNPAQAGTGVGVATPYTATVVTTGSGWYPAQPTTVPYYPGQLGGQNQNVNQNQNIVCLPAVADHGTKYTYTYNEQTGWQLSVEQPKTKAVKPHSGFSLDEIAEAEKMIEELTHA